VATATDTPNRGPIRGPIGVTMFGPTLLGNRTVNDPTAIVGTTAELERMRAAYAWDCQAGMALTEPSRERAVAARTKALADLARLRA
jgi:hypothetical protein